MSQTILITRTDIAQYVQISDSIYDDVLNQHILDAQFSDIQKLIGSDFYNDLARNYTADNYQTLLNGGIYDYNGITYTNVGLKAVLVRYFYSRYVLFGGYTDTPFSFVEKLNDNSKIVDNNGKKTVSKMNEQMSFTYWENVKQFLDRNSSDYTFWDYENCINTRNNFRISRIG